MRELVLQFSRHTLTAPGFEPATPDRETDDLPLYQCGNLGEVVPELPYYPSLEVVAIAFKFFKILAEMGLK